MMEIKASRVDAKMRKLGPRATSVMDLKETICRVW